MSPKKLTESDKQDILKLYRESDETTSTLAAQYGVSNSTISRLLKMSLDSTEYDRLIQQKKRQGRLAGRDRPLWEAETTSEGPSQESPQLGVRSSDESVQEAAIYPEALSSAEEETWEADTTPGDRSPIQPREPSEIETSSSWDFPADEDRSSAEDETQRPMVPSDRQEAESSWNLRGAEDDTETAPDGDRQEESNGLIRRRRRRSAREMPQVRESTASPTPMPPTESQFEAEESEFPQIHHWSPRTPPSPPKIRNRPSPAQAKETAEMSAKESEAEEAETHLQRPTSEDTWGETATQLTFFSDSDENPSDFNAWETLLDEDLAPLEEAEDDFEDLEEEDWEDDTPETITPTPIRTTDVQVLPLADATLPKSCYLVIDRSGELVTRPLKDFSDLGRIPNPELHSRTLPIFENHKVARRFSGNRQRVIKVPDARILAKTSAYLEAKGIARLLFDGRVYALDKNES